MQSVQLLSQLAELLRLIQQPLLLCKCPCIGLFIFLQRIKEVNVQEGLDWISGSLYKQKLALKSKMSFYLRLSNSVGIRL